MTPQQFTMHSPERFDLGGYFVEPFPGSIQLCLEFTHRDEQVVTLLDEWREQVLDRFRAHLATVVGGW